MKRAIVLLFILTSFLGLKAQAQCTANAGGDRAWCHPPVILGGAVAANGGTPPYTYLWAVNNTPAYQYLDDYRKPNPTVINSISGDSLVFELQVTDANGAVCSDETVVYFSHFYTFAAFPQFHAIHQGDSVFLSGHILIGGNFPTASYLWYPTRGLTDSTSDAFWAKPDVRTEYYVRITDDKGCMASGVNCYIVNVLPPLSIGETKIGQSNISVYPNPAKDNLFIETTAKLQSVSLCDMAGRELHRHVTDSGEISLKGWKAGIYILSVTDAAGHTGRFKIVKQ